MSSDKKALVIGDDRQLRDGEVVHPVEIRRGPLSVDLARRRVQVNDVDVALTKKEYELLRVLTITGRAITQQNLLKALWGPAHTDDAHYLRTYIGRLRRKLGDDPANPRFIENVPGSGYRLAENPPG